MAKSDFICEVCNRKRGTNWMGDPTEKYECAQTCKIDLVYLHFAAQVA